MKKIYYLKTCNTSVRILKQLKEAVSEEYYKSFAIQEIKTQALTVDQLEEIYALAGTYESLFSKRAKKYTQMGLKNQALTEKDFRRLLLDEYTFLKRPVIRIDNAIFIGNTKKNVQDLLEKVKGK